MKYCKKIALTFLSLIAIILNVSAQKEEGDIERKAGNYQKAINYYYNENQSSYIALRLAQCYSMTGQTDSAFYYLNVVIESEKENPLKQGKFKSVAFLLGSAAAYGVVLPLTFVIFVLFLIFISIS